MTNLPAILKIPLMLRDVKNIPRKHPPEQFVPLTLTID